MLKNLDQTHFLKKQGYINCSGNSTIVQNFYYKTFHYENDQNGNSILFFFYLLNIHLINTLPNLSPLTFCFIKPVNFNAKIEVFNLTLSSSYEFVAKNVHSS